MRILSEPARVLAQVASRLCPDGVLAAGTPHLDRLPAPARLVPGVVLAEVHGDPEQPGPEGKRPRRPRGHAAPGGGERAEEGPLDEVERVLRGPGVAAHERVDLDKAVDAFKKVGKKFDVIKA